MTIDTYGKYIHNIDAKGRLTIPSNFCKGLDGKLLIIVEPRKRAIYLFEEEGFKTWCEGFLPANSGNGQRNMAMSDALSAMRAMAVQVELDDKKRIILPEEMRKKVGITGAVAVCGNKNYLELWSQEKREKFDNSFDFSSVFYDDFKTEAANEETASSAEKQLSE